MDAKSHWESVHEENSADEVSWFQARPERSLELIRDLAVSPDTTVLDVGCGQEGLARVLVGMGFRGVTCLDISAEAIRRAKERLGPLAAAVEWVQADILDYVSARPFGLWHDRALLHFYLEDGRLGRYRESLARNLESGGAAIVATFAPDGPEKCSGLPVRRHDAESLRRVLGRRFTLVREVRETHVTPWGARQAFQWAAFRSVPQVAEAVE